MTYRQKQQLALWALLALAVALIAVANAGGAL